MCRWNPTVIFSMEIKLMTYKISVKDRNDGEGTEECPLDEHGVNLMG